ncbi:transposase [Candidatus Woesearchaeota archaeon]|nr:transposase [Candidatus Woesearchaeota archaeon]
MSSKTKKHCRAEFKSFLKKLSISEEYAPLLAETSTCNTYIETISNKADSLHYNIAKGYVEYSNNEFSKVVKNKIKKLHLGAVDIIADITSENFYGKSTGLYLHNWTGEDGVQAKYHFLVAGILFRNKIFPFYVAILPIGTFKSEYIGKICDLCGELGLKVRLVKLDRGFYSGEVIDELELKGMNYLIFAKKSSLFRCMLEGTDKSVIVKHEIKYKKNKSSHKAETDIALVKNVEGYDWVFATNVFLHDAKKYVKLYRARWSIETMFRVHDEARIKSKSVNPLIRLFYFMISMLLLFMWNLHSKKELPFKRFVINLEQMLKNFGVSRAN